jgi:hypothetical protein
MKNLKENKKPKKIVKETSQIKRLPQLKMRKK